MSAQHPVPPRQWIGERGNDQVLLSMYADGSVELTTRPRTFDAAQQSVTWLPPSLLEPIGDTAVGS
jgi:hypothetical protein